MSHHYFEGEHDPLPTPKGTTVLSIEVKDAETKLWITAPQVEALGMKEAHLVLRATFPVGSLYGDSTLLTKKARILRNGQKHATYKFDPVRVDYRQTSLILTFMYKPKAKELRRLRDLKLPKYTGHAVKPPFDWDEAALYR